MRRRWLWIVVALVAVLCFCLFGLRGIRYRTTRDVAIEMSGEAIAADARTLEVTITNHMDGEILYGLEYRLDRRRLGVWVPMGHQLAWPALGYTLAPNASATHEYDTTVYTKSLSAGRYRLGIPFACRGRDYISYVAFDVVDSR